MLSSFLFSVLIGTLLGFLSGIGTGGGSLLILYLTLVLSMPQNEAKIINLLFFLPSSVIASLFRWKQGSLEIKKILPAILAGSVFAGIFAFFSPSWNVDLLKKLFGILLIFTGLREMRYRPKK